MNRSTKLHGVIALTAILILGTAVAALAAGTTLLNNYQVDFIEVIKNESYTTWTYAVTADGDEATGLSHWTLGLDIRCGYTVVSPTASPVGVRSYTTLTSYVPASGPDAGSDICTSVYQCQAASYNVEIGPDATTGVSGIKFQDADVSLAENNPGTHIFQITVANAGETRLGDTGIAVKVGGGKTGYEVGLISGPVCAPSAVFLSNLNASSNSAVNIQALTIAGSLLALVLLITSQIFKRLAAAAV